MEDFQGRPLFRDRADAGRQLSERLRKYQGFQTVVLAIPRGGVPVGYEVASALGAEFDIVSVRKIPIPHNIEAGYGAVTEDGVVVLNEPLVGQLGLERATIEMQAAGVRAEINRRASVFRRGRPRPSLKGKTAIIIDDGLASGYTMLAAVRSVRQQEPAGVVVAVPVASGSAYDLVRPNVDDLVAVHVAHTYSFAVASFYHRWYDLTDEEVVEYLDAWRSRRPTAA